MSEVYEFTESPETFRRDYEMSWLLFGQVFITNRLGWQNPVVVDPAHILISERAQS